MLQSLLQFFGLVMTRCYGSYGCYSLGGNFYSIYRPINVFPMSPETINVTFFLHNRQLYNDEQVLDYTNSSTLNDSAFCSSCQTKIIIHGFTESATIPWVKAMTKELLKKDDYNVIVADWKNGALIPYTQSVANARVTGVIVAHFIKQLQNTFNISAQSIHLIGHSLGAHVAGYAGHSVTNLGRITGLDPAKPYFEKMPEDVRLDPSDALFVDVIHTDIGSSPLNLDGIGYHRPIGHLDFYPNGGKDQPGCKEPMVNFLKKARGKITDEMLEYLMCNHMRSFHFFIESINSVCPFLSTPCEDWAKYQRGECFQCNSLHDNCIGMGLEANDLQTHTRTSPMTKFYLVTGHTRQYCKYHYKVVVDIDEGSYGELFMTLVGTDADTSKILFMNSEVYFKSGHKYTFVFGEKDVGEISGVIIQWEPVTKPFNPSTWYLWRKPVIRLHQLQVTSLESGKEFQFCFDAKLSSAREISSNNCVN